jgi:hypothetical protein
MGDQALTPEQVFEMLLDSYADLLGLGASVKRGWRESWREANGWSAAHRRYMTPDEMPVVQP